MIACWLIFRAAPISALQQHWVVASVTTVDAAFVAAAEHVPFSYCMRHLAVAILVTAWIAGTILIWRRHFDYFFYRDAIAKMLQSKRYLPDQLKKPAVRNTLSALSGVLIYSFWILITSAFAEVVLNAALR